jgi:hypothetical protein|tara:strand:- start:671 stop:1180 length:510 start_codon:yes stop_codon:yes gene_type:complete
MERAIKQKIDTFSLELKNSIKEWLTDRNVIDKDGNDVSRDFIQYIFDYETLVLEPDDFKKRKRIKNQIPNYDRCCALRSNYERCTRKKKKDCNFCGTHNKGTPYGTIDDIGKLNKVTKITIWLEEINGIHQYIDENHNVYSTEDMNSSINPPRVISNWIKDSEGKYRIK